MNRSKGFTLIEIVVAVLIIGILASIAYPNYLEYVVKSRRVAAESCLMEYGQYMEQYRALNMKYTTDSIDPGTDHILGTALNCAADNNMTPFYSFSFASVGTRSYTIQAVPQGVQANDDIDCGVLSINQLGVKSVSGSAGEALCW
jgi:type IV pilus assembly protein PilE